jgi:hypothetical protein
VRRDESDACGTGFVSGKETWSFVGSLVACREV